MDHLKVTNVLCFLSLVVKLKDPQSQIVPYVRSNRGKLIASHGSSFNLYSNNRKGALGNLNCFIYMQIAYSIVHTVEKQPRFITPRTDPLIAEEKYNYPLKIRCRDFLNITIGFESDQESQDVFDSMRSLSCLGKIPIATLLIFRKNRAKLCVFISARSSFARRFGMEFV